MGAKELLSGLADWPAVETIEVNGCELRARRVSAVEAMRCAGKASEDDPTIWMAELASISIVDEDGSQPLANPEGVQLILSLPPGDFMAVTGAAMKVNGFDQGNSQRASGSSTGSASPSE